ncbi:hypothetical protein LuPra_06253 [Luteitalea pratensis]|uniref:Carrier domain-containing protein n=1 Tax=Luteitalea pratensis TaxID=1855912 RepID=A0A143PW27_LUTPR|nr:acyl carrier protein [Luteitalea pratensis]AMY12967.1 hypothetical protein LuPra_06253 [Luteitalea pratensis]
MPTTKEQCTNLVYECLDAMNELLVRDTPLGKAPDTVLIGDGGLDSLALVNFIGMLEDSLDARLHCNVVLADEDVPFATVGELVDLIHRHVAQ